MLFVSNSSIYWTEYFQEVILLGNFAKPFVYPREQKVVSKALLMPDKNFPSIFKRIWSSVENPLFSYRPQTSGRRRELVDRAALSAGWAEGWRRDERVLCLFILQLDPDQWGLPGSQFPPGERVICSAFIRKFRKRKERKGKWWKTKRIARKRRLNIFWWQNNIFQFFFFYCSFNYKMEEQKRQTSPQLMTETEFLYKKFDSYVIIFYFAVGLSIILSWEVGFFFLKKCNTFFGTSFVFLNCSALQKNMLVHMQAAISG